MSEPATKIWEFAINKQEDLLPFADLLEATGHPGATVVRILIEYKRFPYKEANKYPPMWTWYPHESTQIIHNESHRLPMGALRQHNHTHHYFSATEAIWAVINADIHKGDMSWYKTQLKQ